MRDDDVELGATVDLDRLGAPKPQFDFDRLGQASRRFVEFVPIDRERVVCHFVLLCEGGSKMKRRETEALLEEGVCDRPPTGGSWS